LLFVNMLGCMDGEYLRLSRFISAILNTRGGNDLNILMWVFGTTGGQSKYWASPGHGNVLSRFPAWHGFVRGGTGDPGV